MIDRIDNINDFGIFRKHSKSPDFTRHTTIYGWNGSGKTTLSRLFAEIGSEKSKYPSSKYKVSIEGSIITESSDVNQNIVVFNEDYVQENAPNVYDSSSSSKHIFSIGEESKGLAEKIKSDLEEKTRLENQLNKTSKTEGLSLRDQLKEKNKQYDKIFTDIARTISAAGTGTAARNYRSDKAKTAFQSINKSTPVDNSLIDTLKKRTNQELKSDIKSLDIDDIIENLKSINTRSKKVASRRIDRDTLKELEISQDRSEWALEGLRIHKDEGLAECLFCGNNVSKDRWNKLESFFSKEYQALYNEIASIRSDLRGIYSEVNTILLPDKNLLYQDIQGVFEEKRASFDKSKNSLLEKIKECGRRINTKLENLNLEIEIEDIDFADFRSNANGVSEVIKQHNSRSENIDKDREEAFHELETHYLQSIYSEVNEIKANRDELDQKIKTIEAEIRSLDERISTNEARIRNTHLGCKNINEILSKMLGRNDLYLKDETEGYKIYRDNILAEDLSEGEKTIITFSYFIARTTINKERLTESIVIIDDPISSLDIDMIHKVFAVIKTKLSKSKQLIILTHSFEALNQIKKWYGSNKQDSELYSILMIRNGLHENKRCAHIEPIDPTLKNYETEYHFLFKRLVDLRNILNDGNDPELAQIYDYPNIARKVIECYLAFKIPNSGSLSSRLRLLRKEYKDTVKMEEIEDVSSFINSGSHLDSKTGLLQFDSSLTKNIKHYVEATLSLIEKTDQLHFRTMMK